jgi:hypothetical protein
MAGTGHPVDAGGECVAEAGCEVERGKVTRDSSGLALRADAVR